MDETIELTQVLVGGKILSSLSTTAYVPTGGVLTVTVRLYDGASARDFFLREASIQLLPGGPA